MYPNLKSLKSILYFYSIGNKSISVNLFYYYFYEDKLFSTIYKVEIIF